MHHTGKFLKILQFSFRAVQISTFQLLLELRVRIVIAAISMWVDSIATYSVYFASLSVFVDVIPHVGETFDYTGTESASVYVHIRSIVPVRHTGK